MLDAGLISMDGKTKVIPPPIMDSQLMTYLKDCGEEPLLKAITGVA